MKRYIKSNIQYDSDSLNTIKNALRQIFRDDPQAILSIIRPPFQYIIGRYPATGRIEIWNTYVSDIPDPQDPDIVNPSFDHGMRLDRGYDDVAHYVVGIEPDLSKWTQS